MPRAFTKENIFNDAPLKRGVYFLYDLFGILIYIGRAAGDDVTIYSRLISHFRGDEGTCTQSASSFDFEVCNWPTLREVELLKEYKRLHGELPRCNERIG